MADLLLKVGSKGPDPAWQDGDIIVAISDRRRKAILARAHWRQCVVRCPEGEYKGGGLHEEMHRVYHRDRFRVVSATEIEVTRAGFAPYIVGPTPKPSPVTGRMEHMDVREWLKRRRASGKKLFRDPVSNEIRWYGRENPLPPEVNVDALRQKFIDGHGWQAGTGYVCPALFPWGRLDYCCHLCLCTEDFGLNRERELIGEVREPDPTPEDPDREVMRKRRRCKVEWQVVMPLSPASIAKALDRARHVDWRDWGPYDSRIVVTEKVI